MSEVPKPPIKRFKTRIDMRQVETEQRRYARKVKAHQDMRANPERKAVTPKCPACSKFKVPVMVKTTSGDVQRCEECFATHGDLVEILRWGA